jgi:hypothetical protein
MQDTYPLGTIVYYGPDDRTITKMVASVIKAREAAPTQMEWRGHKINEDLIAVRELGLFFKTHAVVRVVMSEKIAGCEHEPGVDYPEDEDCPYCPFWAAQP